MAFLAVLYLGKKDGALAAGLGAALSDLLTGAMIWVLPTFIFKFIMGYIMGVVLEKGNNEKMDWIVGASLGGLFQCFAYTLFKIPLFTAAVAFASVLIPQLVIFVCCHGFSLIFDYCLCLFLYALLFVL